MSRMKFFCHLSSLNGRPWPKPLGTVSFSMNAMTSRARCLPLAVRLTCEEVAELARRRLGIEPGGNAGAGGRGESKFGGISDHVARGVRGDFHERVLHGVAERALDHQALRHRVAVGHALERALGVRPAAVSLTVGSERLGVGDG